MFLRGSVNSSSFSFKKSAISWSAVEFHNDIGSKKTSRLNEICLIFQKISYWEKFQPVGFVWKKIESYLENCLNSKWRIWLIEGLLSNSYKTFKERTLCYRTVGISTLLWSFYYSIWNQKEFFSMLNSRLKVEFSDFWFKTVK